ncbi:hypothetical protein [Tateyamaria sp. ANG-S1]|uniref:hypothetical protein n=1 Tax=Tateyamaria sp. ANG-S1 TaxID=1577905 RepID=UPI00057CC249|nr:hypothetical protein [Tateyamaria sp. ANG-S1]KIC48831.1 hypothetical protein RA29_14235 [Tateyamaria sp. ANG-S1]
MPHCDLSYSGDLNIDAKAILAEVEACILRHDDGAGQTKGRAYPAVAFLHTHMKASVALLAKPHRGAAFTAALQKELVDVISAHLPRPCWLSVDITFSSQTYHTEFLE